MTTVVKKPLERETAQKMLGKGQTIVLVGLCVAAVVGLVFWTHAQLVIMMAAILLFYLLFVDQKFVLHGASLHYRYPPMIGISPSDPDLPMYTLFVPLYHEANMLKGLVKSINSLQYPKDKLQVLLLLEEDDLETQAEAIGMELDEWFEIVTIPDVHPKGKPKALNVGLEKATGVYSVIYDAEDRPDPDQLLKAVAAFRSSEENVACVQARLFFWNEDSTWVTRFYWTEYVVHFEWVLPGLAKLGLIPPLGGTSNHFRTEILREAAIARDKLPVGAEGIGGWDPYNVTEDAELAGALALRRYRVKIIDSVTREEATSRLRVADKQRRRWLKGYLQTGLVYTRHPLKAARQMGFWRWFCYVLLMLGTPISLLLNPIMWGLTIAYFLTRSPEIESLFPPLLFYIGIGLIVGGNLLLFYQLVGACLHRGGYGTIKYLLLTPLWWIFTSWSAYQVLWELARPSTRHKWNKTPHGHDLHKEQEPDQEIERIRLAT
jgi:glycosyltransferase XagB